MEEKIKQIQQEYTKKIEEAKSLANLDELFLEVFGKNGVVTLLPKDFASLSVDEKKTVGPLFNQLKTTLEQTLAQARLALREEEYQKREEETLVLDKKAEPKKRTGHLHPLTQFEKDIVKIFAEMGFQQFDAPEVDSDYYNFEVLNMHSQHPARDLWDTLYIEGEKYGYKPGQLLLRTHTSNSQVRIMEQFKPPFRMMIIDRCFRYENLDARHEHTFDQFELVYVDKGLSMANLQYLSEQFLKKIFGPEIKVRLKPGYYPFTEPSAGIQGECIFCKGKGCKICGGVGWLELAGAGMIHPNVLKNGGIDPNEYSGIAWGVGPLRMAMLKWGIEDIRTFLSGDLKFLEKF